LYGTAEAGGSTGEGVVFRLILNSGSWVHTTVWDFCTTGGTNCTDGANPIAGITVAGAGDLYGATSGLGPLATGGGVVFHLVKSGGSWGLTPLYAFCSQRSGICTDGDKPTAALLMDATGNLIGTTEQGGTNAHTSNGGGVVFRLLNPVNNPDQTNGGWCVYGSYTEWCITDKYQFCQVAACADGSGPTGGLPLIMDSNCNLYGTTSGGGVNGDYGTIFKVHGLTESLLYSFCPTDCSDGRNPAAGIIMDPATDDFYGTTEYGGTGTGTAFRLQRR
jgi:uncharacterized repeat protein (TIGR03803 family)